VSPTFDDGLCDIRRRGWSVTITPHGLDLVTEPGAFPHRFSMPGPALLSGPTFAWVIERTQDMLNTSGPLAAPTVRPIPRSDAWLLY
jgi:hypothetical protein